MKKQQEKRLVIQELTKSRIEGIGINREIRKVWKPFALVFAVFYILALIAFSISNKFSDTASIVGYISLVLAVIIFISFSWYIYRAGKMFWNEIKDKEEPIKL